MNQTSLIYDAVSRFWNNQTAEYFPAESFHYFEETESTNSFLLNQGLPNHCAVAEFQTAGRGRRGDRWEAPPKKNLLFSFSIRLPDDKTQWTRLPQITGWQMALTIQRCVDPSLPIKLKWPNDIYLDGKKLGGILVETIPAPEPIAVVGIGINVNIQNSQFPDELQAIATTIYSHAGCETNRWFLLGDFLNGMVNEGQPSFANFTPCLDWARSHDFLHGKKVKLKKHADSESLTEVICSGLGENGELLVSADEDSPTQSISSVEQLLFC